MHRAESQLPVSAYGTGMKPRFRTKQSQNIECLRPLICFRLFYSSFPPLQGGGFDWRIREGHTSPEGVTDARNPGGAQCHRPEGEIRAGHKATDPKAHNARTNGAVSVPPPYAGVRARPDSLLRARVVTVSPITPERPGNSSQSGRSSIRPVRGYSTPKAESHLLRQNSKMPFWWSSLPGNPPPLLFRQT